MKSEAACEVRNPIAHPSRRALRQRPTPPAVATQPASPELPQEAGGQRRRVPQHVHLFREGDPAKSVYQLVDGAVMLYKLLPDGRRSIVEVLIGAGDVFGISALPINDCSAETLVASEVAVYDRATLETSPELARGIASRLRAQFCAMHEHAVLLGRKTALERVASFIMHCVPQRGGFNCPGPRGDDDSAHIRLGMTREEIADYLGLTLETVSRVLSKLRRRGIVTIDQHGRMCVNDVCRMCALTGAH
jgi:CRP-like cAMP-binding protein